MAVESPLGALGRSWRLLGWSWVGLGLVFGALGFSWWVLGAQGQDPKAIRAISFGQGAAGVASGKRSEGGGRNHVFWTPPSRAVIGTILPSRTWRTRWVGIIREVVRGSYNTPPHTQVAPEGPADLSVLIYCKGSSC